LIDAQRRFVRFATAFFSSDVHPLFSGTTGKISAR
jgi:hypothetical protein